MEASGQGPTRRCPESGVFSAPWNRGARVSSGAGDSPRLVRRERPGVAAPPRERRAWPGVFEAQSRPPPSQEDITSAEATPATRELVPRRRVSGAGRRDGGAHGLAGG